MPIPGRQYALLTIACFRAAPLTLPIAAVSLLAKRLNAGQANVSESPRR